MPFLIDLLVMIIVIGLLYWLVTLLPLPEPFKTLALVVVIIFCILWILGFTGLWGPGPLWYHYPHP